MANPQLFNYSISFNIIFKRADDKIDANRAKSLMKIKHQDVTLKEAKKRFGLWDNVYHQNAVKNLDPTSRWNPTKISQEQKKKVEKAEYSSEEEIDGKYLAVCLSIQKNAYIIWSLGEKGDFKDG